jgi:glycogen phosphorylase
MQPHLTFHVTPRLPAKLEPLRELVYNIWWTWQPAARILFRQIDTPLWHRVNQSPVRLLQKVSQARLEVLAEDDDFVHRLTLLHNRFRAYINRQDTYHKLRQQKSAITGPIAYFSAEFGFHESIPIYSGGLGILAGDHCKAASDLGLDFYAVTLLYRHGYFKQQIDREGWQHAIELDQNFHHLPVTEVTREGKPVTVAVAVLDRTVQIKLWQMKVGRVTLLLLDTDLAENSPADRAITAQLYGGDLETRIQQEIVLGIGGVRALNALGVHPKIYHMNEGHSAFLALERIRRRIKAHGLNFRAAIQVVAASNIFTTHTPVPAGNDAFPQNMMRRYFQTYCDDIGLPFEELYSFGQSTENPEPDFSMTILALRASRHSNGVSALHGKVSQKMWKGVWKGVPEDEVPITSVTNGIHTRTWLANEIAALYDKFLGSDWEDHLTDTDYWRRVQDIPNAELWRTHQSLKSRLVDFARERVRVQRQRNGETPEELRKVSHMLERDILTIGFARRFATYKRATLLFSDVERLRRLLNHPERPVQFIFAGKAHPADNGGKAFIQKVIEFTRKEGFGHRIAFIEDYDAHIGRRLYQGVDLWLNNPLRPLEASGTSGMKLPPNGGINLSVLDGWWCEGWNGDNGWAIGAEITDGPPEYQDQVDAVSLYSLLENQILPLYYTKPDGELPLAWIQIMKESMRTITPRFNTERMVSQYVENLYEPAAAAHTMLAADNCAAATTLAAWKEQMRLDWQQIRIIDAGIAAPDPFNIPVGDPVPVRARIHLGGVDPANVRVEAYFGETDDRTILGPAVVEMTRAEGPDAQGAFIFTGAIRPADSGSFGLSVRVLPTSPLLSQPYELRLITWSR